MVKKKLKISLFVLTQCMNVTDTHTDTQAWRHRPRLCIASSGKNALGLNYLWPQHWSDNNPGCCHSPPKGNRDGDMSNWQAPIVCNVSLANIYTVNTLKINTERWRMKHTCNGITSQRGLKIIRWYKIKSKNRIRIAHFGLDLHVK